MPDASRTIESKVARPDRQRVHGSSEDLPARGVAWSGRLEPSYYYLAVAVRL